MTEKDTGHIGPLARLGRSALALSLLVSTALVPVQVHAQQTVAPATAPATAPVTISAAEAPLAKVDTSPWLYEGSDIPPDKGWQFGTLENGLRYAVRKNGVPPGQVAIRVRVDAGSLMEEDSERGYAHFLEHLLFRGSKYVKDGEAKRVWQRLGAMFGSDSNAQTTPTQTVYQLDLPNATPQGLEESIKILSGMVQAPTLDQATIDTEKSVVMAEQRDTAGPQQRLGDASREHTFAGQRVAVRSPIGTPQTLGAATAQSIGAFHKRWYRPDKVVIAIAGDGDPAVYGQLINKYFGQWHVDGPSPTPPPFGDPSAKTPVARVVVEPTQPLSVSYDVVRPWRQVTDNIKYTQGLYLDFLAAQIINRRLEYHARNGGSYLAASVSTDKLYRSVDITSVNIVPIGDDWEKALADVRAVIADAVAKPPSQVDIDREFAYIDAYHTKEVENQQNEAGSDQVDSIVRAVDIRETSTDPTNQRWLFRSIKPIATPSNMLKITRKIFEGTATKVLLASPTPVEGGEKLVTKLATQKVKPNKNARLSESKATIADLPPLGTPGTVVVDNKIPVYDMEAIEFSNGTRAIIYNNDAEPGKIRVNVRFGGGRKAVSPTGSNLLWTGSYGLTAGGIGKLNANDVEWLTNGRQMDLNFDVNDDAFELTAETTPADFTDQMKIIGGMMNHQAWNPQPIQRIKASELLSFEAQQSSPMEVIRREMDGALHGGDRRWAPPSRDEVNALTPESFKTFWQPLLAEGPVEVQLFGDLQSVDYKKILGDTIGALPQRKARATLAYAASVPLKPNSQPEVFTHKGDEDQAAAIVAWPTGGGLTNIKQGRGLEVLAAIFNDRLFDRMRQEAGASYAPQVSNDWPEGMDSGGTVSAASLLEPKHVDEFFSISKQIARDLAAKPVTDDELQRAIGPLKERIIRSSSGNMFWMFQLEGATQNPEHFVALSRYLADIESVKAADIQQLAAQYLKTGNAWSMVVLPEKGPNASVAGKAAVQEVKPAR